MPRGSTLIIALAALLYTYIAFNRSDTWRNCTVITWDRAGYYIYLPAIFIYDDLGDLSFYDTVNTRYKIMPYTRTELFYPQSTGHNLNKYPAGIAVMELPFFFFAHLITTITGEPADGFSSYYQLGIFLAAISWVIMGLIALRNLLRRYFAEKVVAIVILLIGFGTNLYLYTAFDAGMSHSFSFALFALTLNWIDRFYVSENRKCLLLAAAGFALIIICRPTNAMLGLVLLCMGISSLQDVWQRIGVFGKHRGTLILAIIVFIAVLGIQLSYWKYITGQWVYYSYQGEGFNFRKPEILNGLFSYRKGWLLYTPLAALCLLGLLPLWRQYPKFAWNIFLYILLHIYVTFCWHQWYYGGGFGARAMIETYAVLALPLAALLHWAFAQRVRALKYSVLTLCSLFLLLNIWQTYQYSLNIIPWDQNTKYYYWKMFFRKDFDEEEWKTLKL